MLYFEELPKKEQYKVLLFQALCELLPEEINNEDRYLLFKLEENKTIKDVLAGRFEGHKEMTEELFPQVDLRELMMSFADALIKWQTLKMVNGTFKNSLSELQQFTNSFLNEYFEKLNKERG